MESVIAYGDFYVYDAGKYFYFLRFEPWGDVLDATVDLDLPHEEGVLNSPEFLEIVRRKMPRWFNTDNPNMSKGKFQLDGLHVHFVIKVEDNAGVIVYDGEFNQDGEQLELSYVSHITGYCGKGVYRRIKLQ